MEEQMNKPESGTLEKSPAQGEQYFVAAVKLAKWIPAEYKKLAAQSKNIEVWKALYLCASDGVPIENVIEAMRKNPPEDAITFARQKYLEEVLIGNYDQELSYIRATTSSLETEVRNMSQALTQIVAGIPQLDAMFPETDVPESGTQEQEQSDKTDDMESQPAHVPEYVKTGRESGEKKDHAVLSLSGIWKKLKQRKQVSIPVYLEKCVEEGYTPEQIGYMLDCMEDGMSIPELERIASPQLPVDMMHRLRMMEERKENKEDGK